jgi:hypothetical protein
MEAGAGETSYFELAQDGHRGYVHKPGDAPDRVTLDHQVKDLAALLEGEAVHEPLVMDKMLSVKQKEQY